MWCLTQAQHQWQQSQRCVSSHLLPTPESSKPYFGRSGSCLTPGHGLSMAVSRQFHHHDRSNTLWSREEHPASVPCGNVTCLPLSHSASPGGLENLLVSPHLAQPPEEGFAVHPKTTQVFTKRLLVQKLKHRVRIASPASKRKAIDQWC